MTRPNPYFGNIPEIGDLSLEYVFLEDNYPVLFICKSTSCLYLCVCRALIPEQKWIISEISPSILQQMINREISVSAAFKKLNAKSCIAKWSREHPVEEYTVFPSSELLDSDLPDKDFFLGREEAQDAKEYMQNYLNSDEDGPNHYKKEVHHD